MKRLPDKILLRIIRWLGKLRDYLFQIYIDRTAESFDPAEYEQFRKKVSHKRKHPAVTRQFYSPPCFPSPPGKSEQFTVL